MDQARSDPVAHQRTTRQHAGESLKDGTNAPGLVALAVGVVALVASLFGLVSGHIAVCAMPNCIGRRNIPINRHHPRPAES